MIHPDVESLDAGALQALQVRRLAELGTRLSDDPAWAAHFAAAGMAPRDLAAADGLANAPFLEKAALRSQGEFPFLTVPMEDVVRFVATSGTTGLPILFGMTAEDCGKLLPYQMTPCAHRRRRTARPAGLPGLWLRSMDRRAGVGRRVRGARLPQLPDRARPWRARGQVVARPPLRGRVHVAALAHDPYNTGPGGRHRLANRMVVEGCGSRRPVRIERVPHPVGSGNAARVHEPQHLRHDGGGRPNLGRFDPAHPCGR